MSMDRMRSQTKPNLGRKGPGLSLLAGPDWTRTEYYAKKNRFLLQLSINLFFFFGQISFMLLILFTKGRFSRLKLFRHNEYFRVCFSFCFGLSRTLDSHNSSLFHIGFSRGKVGLDSESQIPQSAHLCCWWRAVGNSVSDLTVPGIELQTSRADNVILNT